MLLSAPNRSQYDINFSFMGFPVRITPLFWLIAALLGAGCGTAQLLVLWIAAVFVGIFVHELGHALAMRYYGFLPEIIFYGAGGLTTVNSYSQVNRRFLTGWDNIVISAAGPMAGFDLLAIIAGGLLGIGVNPVSYIFGGLDEQQKQTLLATLSYPVRVFIYMLMQICLFWGILNLMPVLPLDGGQISREICLSVNRQEGEFNALRISFFTSIGLAIFAILFLNDIWMATFFGFFALNSGMGIRPQY